MAQSDCTKKFRDFIKSGKALAQIKTAEKRMAEISVLKRHIISYAQTRDIYTEYRKAGYSQKFYEEHRAQLTLHKAAKAGF